MVLRWWFEHVSGEASKIFALLAALTQLLATVDAGPLTSLGPWGNLQVVSGNLNLGAALLAMLDDCCKKNGGHRSKPGVMLLFLIGGALNTAGAIIVFENGLASLVTAGVLSLVALAF